MKQCSLCLAPIGEENPAILSFGHYGNPRYLCPECARRVDTVTLGTDVSEIEKNMDELCALAENVGKDDPVTADAVEEILGDAAKRAAAIKEGTYDFSQDETPDEEETEEIPEELRETEEDKIMDEIEKEQEKKFDSVLNVAATVVILAVLAFIVFTFIVNR